jgi:hypothetical protein
MSSFDRFPSTYGRDEARVQIRAKTRVTRRSLTWDKPAIVALLAASAIFAPLAVAVLKQVAQIFAY